MRKASLSHKFCTYGSWGIFCLFSFYLVGFAVFVFSVTRQTSPPSQLLSAPYDIVVFTGGKDRVKTALALLKQNPSSQLLISGVDSKTGLHQLLYSTESLSFPAELRTHITLGHKALSTIGNAQETAEWVAHNHSHTLLIVTSAYHMPRALAELRKAGPDLQLIPYKVQASDPDRFFSLANLKILCSEYVKFTGVILRNFL